MSDTEDHNPWTTKEIEVRYDNNWIRLEHHDVLNPSGKPGIYGKVHFKNLAIGILPMDEEGNTWLVGQYRYPLGRYSWEIPEGGGPLNIDPLDSAKRELLEECGILASRWERLQEMDLSNSVSDEMAIIYLATELSFTASEPEETEELSLRKLPFEEAYQMVMNGEIRDSMSVAAILRYKLRLSAGV